MKLPTVQSSRSAIRKGARAVRQLFRGELRPSDFGDRDGVALVITLIMLSIITFMAVTFLVLSQRERSSVSTAMDQKTARNASDAGLARVSAELLTRIMLHTNFQDFDLLTSTNYINYNGLHSGSPGNLSPTNVNYDYLDGGGHAPIVNSQDRNINIASLMFNPRPPVFVVTNSGTGAGEFRYYLDLNRNGRFDPNGAWPLIVNDSTGNAMYVNTNGALVSTNLPIPGGTVLVTNTFVGDPEWIGVLERPEELHSKDNRFIGRYAYVVVPVGKTLDINYIHNRAKRLSNVGEGFMRNQGVGTWEINLAGFLADLNTNAWWNPFPGYGYTSNKLAASTGPAFIDANSFLNYRYNNSILNLFPANAVLANPPATPLAAALAAYNIDAYSDGPLMLGTITNESATPDVPTDPWSGSENTNHYFSTQDIFSQMPPGFRSVLSSLGTSNDSYNAYTFYRMLAQLGTDSPVDDRLNINFKNTDNQGNVIPGLETNLMAWTPEDFFTNAANRILSQFTNNLRVSLTTAHIPLYPTNYYTPAVHRALQLAANIFDATTNRALVSGQTNAFYPSVFRPVFTSQGGQVWISGFKEVVGTVPLQFQYYDMAKASNNPGTLAGINIYGVPWVIGAKKDFPNFNEYAMETAIEIGRKVKLFKTQPVGPVTDVKQMLEVGISNSLAVEVWNSYPSSYPRDLRISSSNQIGISIVNQLGTRLSPATWTNNYTFTSVTNIPANTWPPFISQTKPNGSIVVPLQTNIVFWPNAIYVDSPPQFVANNSAAFNLNATNALPEMYLTVTNRVQFSMVDTTVIPNRVVDFVNFEQIFTTNISAAARGLSKCVDPKGDPFAYWCPDLMANTYTPGIPMNRGVYFQIGVSKGTPSLTKQDWEDAGADPNNMGQVDSFGWFVNKDSRNTNLVMQTPFSPTARMYQHTTWQVNDPLVHYTVGDLTDPAKAFMDTAQGNPPLENIGKVNNRYRPWGGYSGNPDPNTDLNISLKDPGMTQSSAWDFPTNKLPNLGWLGRVHRGTPWQTIYMKSPPVNLNDWKLWSGNAVVVNNGIQDAGFTTPVSDYQIFDLFTTAVSDSAARGRLDINQTNLAAWSAVLSGVNVISNSPTGQQPWVVSPAGVYNPATPSSVAAIVQAINASRANTNGLKGSVFPNHVFQHAGDVLATPQLTIASPFLNTNGLYTIPANGINDEVMERIPQQIMSLLTLNKSPRFVIYSFGQTLHPADHSLVTGGTFNGLCTNYQITAESAIRAVVRMEGTPDPRYVDGRVDSEGRSYPPHLVVEQFNALGPD